MLLGFGLYGLYLLGQNTPVAYADPAEHFKYGSTGGETRVGLPVLDLPGAAAGLRANTCRSVARLRVASA